MPFKIGIGHGLFPGGPPSTGVDLPVSELFLDPRQIGVAAIAPAIQDDYTVYSDWADFEANHPDIYSNFSQMIGHGRANLDIVNLGGEQVMMRRFRDGLAEGTMCKDQQLNDVDLKPGPFQGVSNPSWWFEWEMRFSTNWTVSNTTCTAGFWDYKTLLVRMNEAASAGERRWDYKLGANSVSRIELNPLGAPSSEHGVRYNPGTPWPVGDLNNLKFPPETIRSDNVGETFGPPGSPVENGWVDDNWHTFRCAAQYRPDLTGFNGGKLYHAWASIDGVVTHDWITETIPDNFTMQRMSFGSNRNNWPEVDMFRYDRRLKVWSSSPGWGPGTVPDPTEFYPVSPWSSNQNP